MFRFDRNLPSVSLSLKQHLVSSPAVQKAAALVRSSEDRPSSSSPLDHAEKKASKGHLDVLQASVLPPWLRQQEQARPAHVASPVSSSPQWLPPFSSPFKAPDSST